MANLLREVENPMILPVRQFRRNYTFQIDVERCGCGRKAVYEVYESKQPHCEDCKNDAIDCEAQILVEVL